MRCTWPATFDLISTFSRGCTLPVSRTSMARSPRLTVVISDGSSSLGPAPPLLVTTNATMAMSARMMTGGSQRRRLRTPLAMVHSDGKAERRLQLVPLQLQLRGHVGELQLGVG